MQPPALVIGDPHDLDYLAALLSGDWFFAHWALIGLVPTRAVQRGARAIVSDYLDGETVLISISHDAARRARTRAGLVELAELHPESQLATVLAPQPDADPKLYWVLEIIALEAIYAPAYPPPQGPRLAPAVEQVFVAAFGHTLDTYPGDDLQDAFLAAPGEWDRMLRGLGADLRDWLPSWLSSQTLYARFHAFWSEISTRLDMDGMEQLHAWYAARLASHAATRPEWRVPAWMNPRRQPGAGK